jgi:hypothetical protein
MGLNERLGHKKARFVRLGLKAGAVLGIAGGTALGVKKGQTEFDEYKSKEQQKQREENVATFAGIAQEQRGLAQRVDQQGTEIITRTRGGVFGGGIGKVAGVVGAGARKAQKVDAVVSRVERANQAINQL